MNLVTGQSFEIRVEQETSSIFFKGALRLTGMDEYAPILDLLRETFIHNGRPITVDLRELDFLNSSGITMLSRFVIEARDRGDVVLSFVASGLVPWHARSLKNLQRLMPALNICLT